MDFWSRAKILLEDEQMNIAECIYALSDQALCSPYEELQFQMLTLQQEEPFRVFFPTRNNWKDVPGFLGDVLLVSHELTRTGAPVVLQDMAVALTQMGYRVLIASPIDGPLRVELVEAGIPVIIDASISSAEIPTGFVQRMVEQVAFTVVNTLATVELIKRNINTENKIIWWLHEAEESFRFLETRLPEHVSDNIHVYFVSEYVRKQMMKTSIRYQGDIFHYGTWDVEHQPPMQQHDRLRFACVGTYSARKGQDILMDAITQLPLNILEQCEFWFAGPIYDRGIYDSLKKMEQVYTNIKVWGERERTEIYNLFEQVDCIVSPSRDDPLPVVLTECMRIFKVCMCSDATGTAGLITNGVDGVVFKANDAEDLADAITKLVGSRDRLDNMKEKSRCLYEKTLKMDVFVDNLRKIIAQI